MWFGANFISTSKIYRIKYLIKIKLYKIIIKNKFNYYFNALKFGAVSPTERSRIMRIYVYIYLEAFLEETNSQTGDIQKYNF